MDVKTSRVCVKNIVVHLQKTLRAYDEKNPKALSDDLIAHSRMIEMVMATKKLVPKKKAGKGKGKASDFIEIDVASPPGAVVDPAAEQGTPST